MTAADLGNFRSVSENSEYSWMPIGCNRHANSCSAYEYTSLSFFINNWSTHLVSVIWKVIQRCQSVRRQIKYIVSQRFEMFKNYIFKIKSTVVTRKRNCHKYLQMFFIFLPQKLNRFSKYIPYNWKSNHNNPHPPCHFKQAPKTKYVMHRRGKKPKMKYDWTHNS